MIGNSINITNNFFIPTFLGLICAGIVYATLAGKSLPLIPHPRAALIALFAIGMVMCMSGIGQVGVSGRWTSPLAMVGHLMGAAIVVVFISALAGWKLPFIRGEVQAAAIIAMLMSIKYIIGTAGYFFHWL